MGGARLARTRFKIPADLRFKLAFEFFIGFELHTIHTSKIVPVMLSDVYRTLPAVISSVQDLLDRWNIVQRKEMEDRPPVGGKR